MKTVFKRISAAVLALAVTVSAVIFDVPGKLSAITAEAADAHTHTVCAGTTCTDPNHSSDHVEEIEWTKCSTEEQLKTCLINGGNCYIDKNITLDLSARWAGMNSITISKDVKLCLNGNILTVKAINDRRTGLFIIARTGSLTICDCKGEGKILFNTNATGELVAFNVEGKLDLYNGIISSNLDPDKNCFGSCINVSKPDAVFNMYGGSITQNRIANVSGGNSVVQNQGTFIMRGGTISSNTGISTTYNSGVYNKGTFEMYSGASITGNTVAYGGGVYCFGGKFTMHGGEISNNIASFGGGVYLTNSAKFIMEDGTISGNGEESADRGGGVYVDSSSSFNMAGGTISGNKAKYGGGIYIFQNGKVDLSNAAITGNEANSDFGGGIYYDGNSSTQTGIEECRLKIKNSSITGNKARIAGGIYASDSMLIDDCEISGNEVTDRDGGIYLNCGSNNSHCIFLSGKVTISGNICPSSSTEKNLFLYINTYHEGNILKPDENFDIENSSIGVSTSTSISSCSSKGVKVGIAAASIENLSDAFFADVENQEVKCQVSQNDANSQELMLYVQHKLGDFTSDNDTNHWRECSKCRAKLNTAPHEWDAGTETAPPNCTTTGVKTFTCSICSKTKTETIPATGHTEETIPAVAATCTKTGLTEGKKCSVCGTITVAQETVPKKAHTEKTLPAVAATCTEDGKTAGKQCSVCGTIIEAQTTIKAKGHSPAADPAVAATCTTAGKTAGRHCSVCNEVLTAQETIDPLGHDWDEGEVTTAPTCTAAGVKTFTCTRSGCGATKTEAVDAKGHNPVNDPAVAATCTAKGKTAGSHCSVCKVVITAQEDVPALGHDWGDWSIVAAPTNSAAGTAKHVCQRDPSHTETKALPVLTDPSWTKDSKAAECTVDGYEKYTGNGVTITVTLPQTGHTVADDARVEPTCTAAGKTAGRHCSVCNEVLTAQETIDPLGHDWDEGEVTTAPTCTAAGVKTFTCKRGCGETRTETVPMAAHTKEVIPAVAPTCTDTGLEAGEKCSVCGAILTAQATVPALGHDFSVPDGETKPTCTEGGVFTFKCSRCDETEERTVGANGHIEETVAAVVPTCTKAGLTEGKKCKVCGEILTAQTTIPALGHTEETVAAAEAACTTVGKTEGKRCTVCGEFTVPQKDIPALGHDFKEEITKQPTCTVEGAKTLTCQRAGCGETKTEAVPVVPHTEEILPAKAATCTAAGLTEGKRCTVCNTVTAPQTVTAMLEHSWDNGVITTQPAAGTPGTRQFTCTLCGAARTEAIFLGEISTEVKPEANVPRTELKTSNDELIKAALEEDEQEIVKNGTNVKIILSIEDATTSVQTNDKKKVETEISKVSHCKLGQYLDVKLLKIIGETEEKIAETKAPITVTFEIPENLRGKKEYSVIRVHGSETTVLKDQDNDPDTVTIATDKFSTYALVYVERSYTPSRPSGGGSHYEPSEPSESETSSAPSSKPTESESASSAPSSKPAESETTSSAPSSKPTESESASSAPSNKPSESQTSSAPSSKPTESETTSSAPSDSKPAESESSSAPSDSKPAESEGTSFGEIENPATGAAISLIPLALAFFAVTAVTIKRKKK